MITEEHDQALFNIRTDLLLCPTTPSTLTVEADRLGFNRVHPELQKAVYEAASHNDLESGILMCLEAENAAYPHYIVGMPVSPHSREPLSPFYLRQGMKSLRKLISDTGVRRVTLPYSGFCEVSSDNDEKKAISTVSKYMLIKELLFIDATLDREVEFILVHG